VPGGADETKAMAFVMAYLSGSAGPSEAAAVIDPTANAIFTAFATVSGGIA
jgi:hypothetical protein